MVHMFSTNYCGKWQEAEERYRLFRDGFWEAQIQILILRRFLIPIKLHPQPRKYGDKTMRFFMPIFNGDGSPYSKEKFLSLPYVPMYYTSQMPWPSTQPLMIKTYNDQNTWIQHYPNTPCKINSTDVHKLRSGKKYLVQSEAVKQRSLCNWWTVLYGFRINFQLRIWWRYSSVCADICFLDIIKIARPTRQFWRTCTVVVMSE